MSKRTLLLFVNGGGQILIDDTSLCVFVMVRFTAHVGSEESNED